jgi:hypothetical protein
MSSEISRDSFSGILVPHPGLTPWDDELNATEAGLRAYTSTPATTNKGDVRITPAGDNVSADTPELLVRDQAGGLVGSGGRFSWRRATTESRRGYEPTTSIQAAERIAYGDGTVAATGIVSAETYSARRPDIAVLPNHDIVLVYGAAYDNGFANGQAHVIYAVRYSISLQAWQTPVLVARVESNLPTWDAFPCVAADEEGRLFVAWWSQHDSDGDGTVDQWQIATSMSADSGATWTQLADAALENPFTLANITEQRRMSMAADAGQLALLVEVRKTPGSVFGNQLSQVNQFYSLDFGASFQRVYFTDLSAGATATVEGHVSICRSPFGGFVAAWARGGTIVVGVATARLPHAQASIGLYVQNVEVGITRPPARLLTDAGKFYLEHKGGVSICASPDGSIWVHYLTADAATPGEIGPGFTLRSDDAGGSWTRQGQDATYEAGTWFQTAAWNYHPLYFATAWHAGRVLMVSQWTTLGAPATDPGLHSVMLWSMGGYSSQELPTFKLQATDRTVVTLPDVGLAIQAPAAGGNWTFAAPFGTQNLVDGQLVLAGLEVQYTTTLTVNARAFFQGQAILVVEGNGRAGVEVVTQDTGLGLRWSSRIRILAASVELEDRVGAGTASIAIDTTAGILIRVIQDVTESSFPVFGAKSRVLRVAVAAASSTPAAQGGVDRHWQTASVTLTSSAAATLPLSNGDLVASALRFGHLGGIGAAPTSHWAQYSQGLGQFALGASPFVSQANPGDLRGRPYSPFVIQVAGGIGMRAAAGPAIPGDEHVISTRADFSIDAAWNDRSPRHGWRSVGFPAATHIPWTWGPPAAGDGWPGNDLVAVYVGDTQIRTWGLGYQNGGVWTALGAWDTSFLLHGVPGLPFTRQGSTLIPNGVNALEVYASEFDGCWVQLSDGNFRRIALTEAGTWDNTTTAKQAALVLEDVDGTEIASGNAWVIPKAFVAIIQLRQLQHKGLRLVPLSTASGTGDMRIGQLTAGPVRLLSCPNWGWQTVEAAQVTAERSRDRISRVRVDAPTERTWSWDFSEAMVTRWYSQPDWMRTNPTGVATSTADQQQQLQGLLRAMDGPGRPVVGLRHVPQTSDRVHVLVRPSQFCYGELTAQLTVDNVAQDLGTAAPREPSARSIYRIGQVALQELR